KEIPPPAPATLKNAASARDDAKVLTWTSQYNDKEWAARNINDQSLERNWFWSSRKRPEFPQ
ncbi:MAG: hypothetical protein GWM98_03675, partial [Nitrospinaceae bacterium]|nr:hypothetical protein [Nitrospinaceae bacterium]NIR53768.1 hypothetical protein [Nitrospinaceae bacterium]NIS84178.1 hypothetical protein [Nitrospinaceae bacterium]NIT80984.1 hypothetical protein [Nitrospinaceae bacterium]NIU43274.1 hypothetical protein [Nitrospinaceae bacterium]